MWQMELIFGSQVLHSLTMLFGVEFVCWVQSQICFIRRFARNNDFKPSLSNGSCTTWRRLSIAFLFYETLDHLILPYGQILALYVILLFLSAIDCSSENEYSGADFQPFGLWAQNSCNIFNCMHVSSVCAYLSCISSIFGMLDMRTTQ